MPDTCLRLEHVGEPLIVALLTQIQKIGKLRELRCGKPATEMTTTLEKLIVAISGEAPISFYRDVPLQPLKFAGGEHRFDGMSRVDCLAARGSAGLAIEVKLGTARMACGEFGRRFLRQCSRSAQRAESH